MRLVIIVINIYAWCEVRTPQSGLILLTPPLPQIVSQPWARGAIMDIVIGVRYPLNYHQLTYQGRYIVKKNRFDSYPDGLGRALRKMIRTDPNLFQSIPAPLCSSI